MLAVNSGERWRRRRAILFIIFYCTLDRCAFSTFLLRQKPSNARYGVENKGFVRLLSSLVLTFRQPTISMAKKKRITRRTHTRNEWRSRESLNISEKGNRGPGHAFLFILERRDEKKWHCYHHPSSSLLKFVTHFHFKLIVGAFKRRRDDCNFSSPINTRRLTASHGRKEKRSVQRHATHTHTHIHPYIRWHKRRPTTATVTQSAANAWFS